MYKAHIYISLSTMLLGNARRRYMYTLAAEHSRKTVYGTGVVEGSRHRAELTALVAALSRFTDHAQITIHAEDAWILNMINNSFRDWEQRDFKKKSGEPIADADLWRELARLTKYQKILTEQGEHAYSGSHAAEMKKREGGRL